MLAVPSDQVVLLGMLQPFCSLGYRMQREAVSMVNHPGDSTVAELLEGDRSWYPAMHGLGKLADEAVAKVDAVMKKEQAVDDEVLSTFVAESGGGGERLAYHVTKNIAGTVAYATAIVMKTTIQGHRVRAIRAKLGLSSQQLANVLGVHPATVHRWESAGQDRIPIDGVAASILTALDQEIGSDTINGHSPRQLGEQICQALLIGGALLALAKLVNALVDEGRQR